MKERWQALALAIAVMSAAGACTDGAPGGDDASSAAAVDVCGDTGAPVYHRVQPSSGGSLYTTSASEASNASTKYGYTDDEGVAFRASTAPAAGLVPAYRLYDPKTGDHVWTTSAGEKASAASKYGYTTDEGIGFYVSPTSSPCLIPVHRLVDVKPGKHRFATTQGEVASLVAAGWEDEGVKFYASPAGGGAGGAGGAAGHGGAAGAAGKAGASGAGGAGGGAGVARPTGPGTIRYEDVYKPGMTLQQVVDAAGANLLTFPEGTFEFSDFQDTFDAGVDLPAHSKGFAGSGRGTIFQMKPHSSTKSAPTTGTNQLYLIRISDATAPVFENFTIKGTDQGHAYNGLMIRQSTAAIVDNLYLLGASRGYANYPPGETFGINFFRSPGATLRDTEIDGRDETGTRVSASPFGWNTTTDAHVEGGYFHHSLAGMPTFWQTDGVTSHNLRSEYNGTASGAHSGNGINHERSTNIVHYNPTIVIDRQHGNTGCHVSMNNDQTDGTMKIVAPTWDDGGIENGRFLVMSGTNYGGHGVQTTPPVVVDASGKAIDYYWAH